MKKMALIFLGLLGAFATLVSVQPSEFRVERSTEIAATAESVFFHIGDLKEWPRWSPWAARDVEMEMEYSDSTDQVGSYVIWKSKTEGDGKQTITERDPGKVLKLDLEFYSPWEGSAQADFTLENLGDKTKVTWGLNSTNKGFVEKFFYLAMGVNSSIGKDFENGLSSIKELSEN